MSQTHSNYVSRASNMSPMNNTLSIYVIETLDNMYTQHIYIANQKPGVLYDGSSERTSWGGQTINNTLVLKVVLQNCLFMEARASIH